MLLDPDKVIDFFFNLVICMTIGIVFPLLGLASLCL